MADPNQGEWATSLLGNWLDGLEQKDKNQAVGMGLLNIGGGLLSQAGPGGNIGQGFAQGAQAAAAIPQQIQQQAMQRMMFQQKMAQQKAMQGAVAGLPEDQRGLAMMAPEAFAKARAEQMFKPRDPLKLSPGDTLLNPDDRSVIYSAPRAPASPKTVTTAEGVYVLNENGSLGARLGAPTAGIQINNAPTGYKLNPDGTMAHIPGGPADPSTKPLTGDQANARMFADRMRAAEHVINANGAEGTDRTQRFLGAVPLVGNSLVSQNYQMLDQAQRDFINAVLRKESGAAIGKDEFENASKQYFPSPGDTDEVMAQKKANRQLAIDGIARAGGGSPVPSDTDDVRRTLKLKYGVE